MFNLSFSTSLTAPVATGKPGIAPAGGLFALSMAMPGAVAAPPVGSDAPRQPVADNGKALPAAPTTDDPALAWLIGQDTVAPLSTDTPAAGLPASIGTDGELTVAAASVSTKCGDGAADGIPVPMPSLETEPSKVLSPVLVEERPTGRLGNEPATVTKRKHEALPATAAVASLVLPTADPQSLSPMAIATPMPATMSPVTSNAAAAMTSPPVSQPVRLAGDTASPTAVMMPALVIGESVQAAGVPAGSEPLPQLSVVSPDPGAAPISAEIVTSAPQPANAGDPDLHASPASEQRTPALALTMRLAPEARVGSTDPISAPTLKSPPMPVPQASIASVAASSSLPFATTGAPGLPAPTLPVELAAMVAHPAAPTVEESQRNILTSASLVAAAPTAASTSTLAPAIATDPGPSPVTVGAPAAPASPAPVAPVEIAAGPARTAAASTIEPPKQSAPIPAALTPAVPAAPSAPLVQAAGMVFGIALAPATRFGADKGTDPASPRDLALQALTAAAGSAQVAGAVIAPDSAQQATLDMRRHDWPQTMIDHIEALRDAADAVSTRITLVPDALGRVDVSLRHDGDTVHVHLAAENAQARAMLTEAQPRLTEAAQARGIRLGQATVDAGQGGAGQQPRQYQPAAATTPNRASPTSITADDPGDDPDSTRLA